MHVWMCLSNISLTLFCTQMSIYTSALYVQPLYSTLCLILMYYLWINNILDTWTVVCLTATKYEPFKFSVLGFALAYVTNMYIYIIFYEFCLHRFVTKSYMYGILNAACKTRISFLALIKYQCCGRLCFSAAEFQKIAVSRKISGGEGLSHYRPNQCFIEY
jgi:hypothetical protein